MLFPVPRPPRRVGVTVALDIGSHQVKLVAASRANGGVTVTAASAAAMPPGAPGEGAPDEPERAAALLRRIAEADGLVGCPAVGVIGGRRVIVRWVTMPPLTREDALAAARTEAAKLLPMSLDEAAVDVHLLPAGSEQGKWSRALVVAAPRTVVEEYAECMESAGLKPAALDVIQLALLRAMRGAPARAADQHACPTLPRPVGARGPRRAVSAGLWSGHPWGILALGASSSELLVAQGDTLAFCRTLSWGTSRLSAAAGIAPGETAAAGCDELAVSIEGELLLQGRALPGGAQRAAGLAALSGDVSRSLIYYQTQFSEGSYQGVVGRIMLTGGGAAIPGMLDYLACSLGTSVEAGVALTDKEVHIESAAFHALSAQPTAFAPCLGLLLGGDEPDDPCSRNEHTS